MFNRLDFSKIRTFSIKDRQSKVDIKRFARPVDPARDSLSTFIDSLPDILRARDLRHVVSVIVDSMRKEAPRIVMMGAHVVKVGLNPLIIDLLRRGVISHIAMNSAAAIHDCETALFGVTSEDVAASITDGTFGMSRETGEFINGTLAARYPDNNVGYGEALGRRLLDDRAPNLDASILAQCIREDVPVTVHAAIGTDIVHQQPGMDGAVTGEMTYRDFQVFAASVAGLEKGGVVLNIGSAVILPEIFLKALTIARNLGHKAYGFLTANFDMIDHYRPRVNVVERPTKDGGEGYMFLGHHEIMIPLLAAMILVKIGDNPV
ncbi:MAG: hypothetical protein GXO82_10945 [Chlorobi bacterium]|nr:hypothetical protein [Chlorobiota bacterium]